MYHLFSCQVSVKRATQFCETKNVLVLKDDGRPIALSLFKIEAMIKSYYNRRVLGKKKMICLTK